MRAMPTLATLPFVPGRPLHLGVLSDTHLPESRRDLWPQVYAAFAGSDAIIHGGDVHELSYLDRLGAIAPVYVARGNGEEGSGGRPVQPDDERVRATWVLAAGGFTIGVTHDLELPTAVEPQALTAALDDRFDGHHLDVVIHGHTHVESLSVVGDIVCLNPGSPTYPHNLTTQLGTIARLTVTSCAVQAELLQLTDTGVVTTERVELAAPPALDA
jgi:uncharacterized protein